MCKSVKTVKSKFFTKKIKKFSYFVEEITNSIAIATVPNELYPYKPY